MFIKASIFGLARGKNSIKIFRLTRLASKTSEIFSLHSLGFNRSIVVTPPFQERAWPPSAQMCSLEG